MFFVVTTGRSGSQTLAHVLDQHPLCHCLHEPHPILIKLAKEWCHGELDASEVRKYLFQSGSMFPHRIGMKLYGESDQKASFLIEFLRDLGTSTRFIWLLRDGQNVVASTYARGWYSESEVSGPKHLWAKYRLRADLCGDVTTQAWLGMSVFERCCWYWSYTNRMIESQLAGLDASSWMMVKLENLGGSLDEIQGFLDLPYFPLKTVRVNQSPVPIYHSEMWTVEEHAMFDRWCGSQMDRWYAGWRENSSVHGAEEPVSQDGFLKNMVAAGSHLRWFAAKSVGRLTTSGHPRTSGSNVGSGRQAPGK